MTISKYELYRKAAGYMLAHLLKCIREEKQKLKKITVKNIIDKPVNIKKK